MTLESVPPILWLLLKLITLLGIIVYIIFSGVMVRQERLMAHVLEEGFEPVLKTATFIHLLASIAVFVLAVILL